MHSSASATPAPSRRARHAGVEHARARWERLHRDAQLAARATRPSAIAHARSLSAHRAHHAALPFENLSPAYLREVAAVAPRVRARAHRRSPARVARGATGASDRRAAADTCTRTRTSPGRARAEHDDRPALVASGRRRPCTAQHDEVARRSCRARARRRRCAATTVPRRIGRRRRAPTLPRTMISPPVIPFAAPRSAPPTGRPRSPQCRAGRRPSRVPRRRPRRRRLASTPPVMRVPDAAADGPSIVGRPPPSPAPSHRACATSPSTRR